VDTGCSGADSNAAVAPPRESDAGDTAADDDVGGALTATDAAAVVDPAAAADVCTNDGFDHAVVAVADAPTPLLTRSDWYAVASEMGSLLAYPTP
jgi:hypothetical protein